MLKSEIKPARFTAKKRKEIMHEITVLVQELRGKSTELWCHEAEDHLVYARNMLKVAIFESGSVAKKLEQDLGEEARAPKMEDLL